MAILPAAFPAPAGCDAAARMIPATTMGGAFNDFIELPHGRIGLVDADVSGKGVRAACLLAAGCSHPPTGPRRRSSSASAAASRALPEPPRNPTTLRSPCSLGRRRECGCGAAMNVRFERLALTTLVIPEGRLDFGAAAGFQRHIEEVFAGAATAFAAVIIDCSALDYVSSAGLRVFLLAARAAQRAGTSFALCALRSEEHTSELQSL